MTRWRCSTPKGPRGRRDRPHPPPTGCPAPPGRRPGRARKWRRPSTSGTNAWPTPARCWWPPAKAWSADLDPLVASAYSHLAGAGDRSSRCSVTAQLGRRAARRPAAPRRDDLRRGVNTVGPHRDDLRLGSTERGPDPRVTRRTTLPGTVPPAGRPSAHPHRTVAGPDLAARRRLLRARPGPQPGPGGRASRRPVDLTTAAPLPEGIEVARMLSPVQSLGDP